MLNVLASHDTHLLYRPEIVSGAPNSGLQVSEHAMVPPHGWSGCIQRCGGSASRGSGGCAAATGQAVGATYISGLVQASAIAVEGSACTNVPDALALACEAKQ